MKNTILLSLAALLFSTTGAFAEGSGKGKDNDDWSEKAARGYEDKAEMAAKKGNSEHADIYKRMAQMKRDAAVASSKGKKYDWSEYHQLQGKLDEGKQEKAK